MTSPYNVAVAPELMVKTLKFEVEPPPLTLSWFAPGPAMLAAPVIVSPLPSWIAPGPGEPLALVSVERKSISAPVA